MEENTWRDKTGDNRFICRIIINTQQVIYDNGSQGIVSLKTPVFMNEWTSMLSIEDATEKCYYYLFENLICHGFTSGIKTLEFIRKHKVQIYGDTI